MGQTTINIDALSFGWTQILPNIYDAVNAGRSDEIRKTIFMEGGKPADIEPLLNNISLLTKEGYDVRASMIRSSNRLENLSKIPRNRKWTNLAEVTYSQTGLNQLRKDSSSSFRMPVDVLIARKIMKPSALATSFDPWDGGAVNIVGFLHEDDYVWFKLKYC